MLACSGGMAGSECCTVEDVLKMQNAGVKAEVMVDAIRTSGTDLALSATDIADLSAAGVDRSVIDVLNGGPCVCQDGADGAAGVDAAVAGATAPAHTAKKAASLSLKVVYNKGKSFEVVNLGSKTYTGVSLTANGEYVYRLKKLPAGKGDVMRFGNFRSTKTGEEWKKGKLRSITIRTDQGTYSQSF